MPDLVIASSEADAHAADAVVDHHAQMSGALALRVEALVTAAANGDAAAAEHARGELTEWSERELLPHAAAEERAFYPAAGGTAEGRLLIEAMLGEHRLIVGLVHTLARGAADPVRTAATATALKEMFGSHLTKENELIVPLLQQTPGVSVAELLAGMHELIGEAKPKPAHEGCACGHSDPAGHPELDARSIPHAIRHATIFGALETVRPGAGLVLVAPHDPLPLLKQIGERWPDTFSVEYLESGPEAWRLEFVRADS
jgi:uncharacterized protein (DUF2249 family)